MACTERIGGSGLTSADHGSRYFASMGRKRNGLIPTTITVPRQLHGALAERARVEGDSVAGFIRRAVVAVLRSPVPTVIPVATDPNDERTDTAA